MNIFLVFPQLLPQITTSHKQECRFLCSNQMLTDYGFVLLNISHRCLKAVPCSCGSTENRWEAPFSFFSKEFSVFWLIPCVISGLPDFPDRSYFFSFQPSQNMRPKELQASVQDFQRPHRLASMPTICACTAGTSDALGMCGTHCIGNMEHIHISILNPT